MPTISTRLYNARLKTIKSKNDARRVLEEIVLKQGRIYFKDMKNENYYIFFEPSNIPLDEAFNVNEKININELSDKEKQITTFIGNPSIDNPFSIVSMSLPFENAVDELYKVRASYNGKFK